jgi:hypothetical protein
MHEYRLRYGTTAEGTYMQMYVVYVTVVNAMLKK